MKNGVIEYIQEQKSRKDLTQKLQKIKNDAQTPSRQGSWFLLRCWIFGSFTNQGQQMLGIRMGENERHNK